ncbi:MAG TPA: class I SAM-dependent methyltransferase [Longimicrobiaceae bacterium]|nr:class I SAM-dependent methyltransferase [Longimicrobiaceae bacterium]
MADWYAGWVGAEGSEHHRRLAIPALLDLLRPIPGEHVLDVGCGPGVLAPHVAAAGARYTGVDASRKLVAFARRHHGAHGRFLVGDATRLRALPEIAEGAFDTAVFLLSIQDIDPLEDALGSAAWALRPGGRVVLLMTHPCFRVPRQSGWGWDTQRRLRYRRVDRYLTRMAVPMKGYGPGRRGVTRSYHRPLGAYVNGLAACGLLVDGVHEIPTYRTHPPGPRARAERAANREIPLFLGLRAVKP